MASATHPVVLDRIEDGFAVLISRSDARVSLDVPAAWLPAGARDGTALTLTLSVDEAATEAGKQEVASLMSDLLARG